MSFLLQDLGDRRVIIRPTGWQVPESCALYARLGINCPGCGLTRSYINLSAGNIVAALQLNPIGILGYFYTWCQIPLSSLFFVSPALRRRFISQTSERGLVWFNQWIFVGLMISLVIQWLLLGLVGAFKA